MTSRSQQNPIKVCLAGFFEYSADARIRMYAKWLTENDNFVDVICGYKFSDEEIIKLDGARIFNKLKKKHIATRFQYIYDFGFSYLKLASWVTKMYFREKYDVIHFHNIPDFIVFAGFLPKLTGAKLILDIHDPMPEVYLSKYEVKKSDLVMKLVCFEEKISCNYSDAVITANHHFRQNIAKRGIPLEKITVINNRPDPLIFTRSMINESVTNARDKFTMIFPGTIAPRYGLDIAIKALPYIRSRVPNIHLRIIGPMNECSDSLKELAKRLQVDNHVEFISSVPNNEIPQFLKDADVGIYPALPGPHMSIAVPGKILEFATMGLPIVSTGLKIVKEIFDNESVLFFEAGNYKEFAFQIIKINEDPDLRQELSVKAAKIIEEKFPYDQEAANYFSILSKIVAD